MNTKPLNVVYIGSPSFPLGAATSKRRRYMVDYMNENGISAHVLVVDFKHNRIQKNPQQGKYGNADFYDLSIFTSFTHIHSYIKIGKKKLEEWFDNDKKNILIFATVITCLEYPMYRYAVSRGYKIVFDQVETSYLLNGHVPLMFRIRSFFDEWISKRIYKKHPAFVISSALLQENRDRYPSRQLCILPNSAPVLCKTPKKNIHQPLRLLYSGTYAPKDGVNYLIEGVIQAHNEGIDCELILLGRGNPHDMKVLDKIIDLKYIRYIGYVSDEELIKQMLDSDVLCMTRTNSKFANYGFPFKLSEYLSAGNILLATDVGDVSKYVKDKESALIIPPEDSNAIFEAIKYIISHEDRAIQIAHTGFETMIEKFAINKVGKTFISFLQSI